MDRVIRRVGIDSVEVKCARHSPSYPRIASDGDRATLAATRIIRSRTKLRSIRPRHSEGRQRIGRYSIGLGRYLCVDARSRVDIIPEERHRLRIGTIHSKLERRRIGVVRHPGTLQVAAIHQAVKVDRGRRLGTAAEQQDSYDRGKGFLIHDVSLL